MSKAISWSPGRRRLVRLVGSSTADQILSALSNFAITLAVVRGGGPEALGRYAIAFAVYLVVLPMTRALVSEPMLASPRGACDDRVTRSTATVVLSVAALSAALVCGFGIWLNRPEFIALAVALPITLAQDVLRYQAFWAGRPDLAVLLDGGWLVGAILAWPLIAAHPSPGVAILCWAGACGLGMVLTAPRLRLRVTTPQEAVRWWRRDARALAAPMAVESIVFALSAQLVIFAVASLLSAGDLGVLRAGQVYFMPVALTLSGCASVGIPYLAQSGSAITGVTARMLSAGIVAFAVASCALIVVAEPVLHTLLYARAVEVPRVLLIPIAAQVVCSTFAQIFVIMAKAQRRGRDLLATRVSSTVIGSLLLVPAIEIWRIEGAAWLLAIQAALYALHLSILFRARTNGADSIEAPMPLSAGAPENLSSSSLTVSVIIPVYNGEAYVAAAVRSVLNQTHADLEVLVVDDGSSDGTADVVVGIGDARVRLIQQEQGGVAVARNNGLREAAGDVVAFLDHDDLWFPDKLAVQLSMFTDEEVGLVGSFMTYLTDRGAARAAAGEDTAGQHDRLVAGRLMPFPLSSVVARTELLRREGGFDEGLARVAQVEDLDLLARLCRCTRVRTITRPLGYYRLHPNAASFRTFGAMRRGARFVRARLAAADKGNDLSWDDWASEAKEDWTARRTDRANFLYRSAGFDIVSGRKVRGYGGLLSAAALSPTYVFARLIRQHRAADAS